MRISLDTQDLSCRIGPILDLWPDDMPHYHPTGVRKRQREFLTGRRYAEASLTALGCKAPHVGTHADRAPIWPAGFCGSISHSNTLCGAMVAPLGSAASLGLDIERQGAVTEDLTDMICTSRDDPDGQDPTLIFCAKEAFYKMWYPVTGIYLDFSDVSICVSGEDVTATLETGRPARPDLAHARGTLRRLDKHFVVAFALAPRPNGACTLLKAL